MGLDPQFIVQMLLQRQQQQQSLLRDQRDDTERRRAQQFSMGLELMSNPAFKNIDAFLGIAPELTPAQADFLREGNKTIAQQAKAKQIGTGAGATAAANPIGGGSSPATGFQPTLDEVLASLRSVEQQAGGNRSLLEQSLAQVDVQAQDSVLKERAAQRESARIVGRRGDDEGLAMRQESLDLRAQELETRQEQNRINRALSERTKYEKFIKPHLEAFDAVQSVDALAEAGKRGNSSADINLAYAAAKAADRGGRITQPDFEYQWRSLAIDDRIKSFMSLHLAGKLTDKKRDELVAVAKATYRKREKEIARYSDKLEVSLRKAGIDPEDVTIARPPPLDAPPVVPAGSYNLGDFEVEGEAGP